MKIANVRLKKSEQDGFEQLRKKHPLLKHLKDTELAHMMMAEGLKNSLTQTQQSLYSFRLHDYYDNNILGVGFDACVS